MKPKRTIEELQQIEHAIRIKFGEDALSDFKSMWNEDREIQYKKELEELEEKDLLREKNEEKIEKDGFLVSKRLLSIRKCEGCFICGKYFTDASDNIYLLKFECCQNCYITHVEGREERWKDGWRPKPITNIKE